MRAKYENDIEEASHFMQKEKEAQLAQTYATIDGLKVAMQDTFKDWKK